MCHHTFNGILRQLQRSLESGGFEGDGLGRSVEWDPSRLATGQLAYEQRVSRDGDDSVGASIYEGRRSRSTGSARGHSIAGRRDSKHQPYRRYGVRLLGAGFSNTQLVGNSDTRLRHIEIDGEGVRRGEDEALPEKGGRESGHMFLPELAQPSDAECYERRRFSTRRRGREDLERITGRGKEEPLGGSRAHTALVPHHPGRVGQTDYAPLGTGRQRWADTSISDDLARLLSVKPSCS